MKLTTVLLLVGFLQVHAVTYAQRYSIKVKNISTIEFIDHLRQKTGYDIICDAGILKGLKRISVEISDASMSEILDKAFAGLPLVYKFQPGNTILITRSPVKTPETPRQTKVSGRVISAKDQLPLAGVSVSVKGTTAKTMTDQNGKFTVAAAKGNILVFTSIGFSPAETVIQEDREINVSLNPSVSKLDEIVVIGYGTQRKSDLTASVSTVSKEALSERTILSVADALKGKAAGVQITQNDGTPGSENTIRIRGASSVSAGSTPLYVVDGILQDDINDLNPGDIESIEILKDASGTAIYGSRGANGVVLITTKIGKAGKTQVELYTNAGVQNPGHLYHLMNSSEYVRSRYLAQYVYSPASSTDPNVPATVQMAYNYFRETPLGTPGGFWGVPVNSPYAAWSNYNSPDSINTDWQGAMFHNGLIQEYRTSILGGSKDTKFSLLGGYIHQDGLIVYSGYKRYNGRFNLQQKLTGNITLTANISGTRSAINGFTASSEALNGGIVSNTIITSMLHQPPTNPLTFTDVEDNLGLDGYLTTNPYSLAKHVTNKKDNSDWVARLGADWKISKSLSFRSTGTYTNIDVNTDSYYPKFVQAGSRFNGRALISRGSVDRYLNENLLYYTKNFGKNRLKIMGGAIFEAYKNSLNTAENQNFNIELLGVYGLSNGTVPIIPTYRITDYTMSSFLSRAEYNYNGKYLATATIRADGSSRFSADNKWGYFPSLALAWNVTEENWFKNMKSISTLKVRSSIGQSGNTAIPSYLTLSTIATYFSPMDGYTPDYGVVIERPENLALKWETTDQVDAGLDLGLFNEKVSLTFDWYLKRTRDLLIQKVTPGYSGYRSNWTNLGSVQNSGIEISLGFSPVVAKSFNWNINGNFGFNRSKAIEIGDDLLLAPGVVSGIGASAIIRNGEALGQWYGYQTDGIYQSSAEIQASGLTAINGIAIGSVRPGSRKFIDQNGDHVIDANDRTILGRGQPLFSGGLTNFVSYKNISLNAVIQYSYGNKVYNANRVAIESGRNTNNFNHSLATGWRPDMYDMTTGELVEQGNPNNSYRMPGSVEENLMLSDWIEDGSFIRLSDVTLTWRIPISKIEKIGMRGLSVFASGKNLFILTNYSGYDPEVNTRQGGFGDLMPSLDYASYPRSRVYSIGVKAQF